MKEKKKKKVSFHWSDYLFWLPTFFRSTGWYPFLMELAWPRSPPPFHHGELSGYYRTGNTGYYMITAPLRTVQLQCKDGPFYKEDAVQVLSSCLPNFSLNAVESLWKTERNRNLFLTLKDINSFNYLIKIKIDKQSFSLNMRTKL